MPMTADQTDDDGEISLVALATTVVRNLRTILIWSVAVGALVALKVAKKPVVYEATATIATGGGSAPQMTGFSALAGQLGLMASGSATPSSPDFYIMLMKSPVILSRVIQKTMVVPEKGPQPMTVAQVFQLKGKDSADLARRSMDVVKGLVVPGKQRNTGLVQVTVLSPWPSLSLGLVGAFVASFEDYNRETRQTQAAEERSFIERRMAEAMVDLREAEDRLQRFLAANREISPTSMLAFERDRLARAVALKQQVYTTLASSYEDARIREVRDTPVINVIEPPRVKPEPEKRERMKSILIGMAIGAFLGLVAVLVMDAARRLARHRREEADELAATLRQTRDSVTRVLRFGR